MARLPNPGQDAGQWGEILNEYLLESHDGDGALKDIPQSKVTGLSAALTGKASTETTDTLTERVSDVETAIDQLDSSKGSDSPQSVARRLIASAASGIPDTRLSTVAVTVTLSAASAASSITGGVRIAPARLSASIVDVAHDPHFEYIGIIPGRLGVTSGDMTYADFLTGGASQNARNRGRYRFVYTGSVFETYFRMRGTEFSYRILIDGLPLTVEPVVLSVATSSRYYLKLDFGGIEASREITLEIADPEFGGVVIGPTDSITRPQRTTLLVTMGDSHTAGAVGVGWSSTWPRRTAGLLGVQFANVAIGGTGFLNTGTGNFRLRLATDLFPLKPDVFILEGSWNDAAASEPALQAEAKYVYDAVREALPNALLIAAGPWVTGHNLATTLDAHDVTLRAQAEASGWNGYISYRDPLKLKATTASWAVSTVYALGDMRVYNGLVQVCVSAHTSTLSFDQTRWRSTAMVGGSGRVGAVAGNGNADILVSSDGVHGTLLAHQVKARFVAAEVQRIAESIAGGQAWAN